MKSKVLRLVLTSLLLPIGCSADPTIPQAVSAPSASKILASAGSERAISLDGAVASAPSDAEREAFSLGYCIEHCALLGHRYAKSVQALGNVPDADESSQESALAGNAVVLRSREHHSWKQAAVAAHAIGLGQSNLDWITDESDAFLADPKPPPESSAQDSANARLVMATLDEISAMTVETSQRLQSILGTIKIVGSKPAVWSFEAGQLMADIGMSGSPGDAPDPVRVRALVAGLPRSASAELRRAIAPLVTASDPPLASGPGNLSALVSGSVGHQQAQRQTRTDLVNYYECGDLLRALNAP